MCGLGRHGAEPEEGWTALGGKATVAAATSDDDAELSKTAAKDYPKNHFGTYFQQG